MPSLPTFDCYEALGVSKEADAQEITASFRKLALQHHPDKNPDKALEATESFKKISEAYEVLKNPSTRRQYDFHLQASSSSPSSSRSSSYADDYSWTEDDDEEYEADLMDFLRRGFVPGFRSRGSAHGGGRGGGGFSGFGYGTGLSEEEVEEIYRQSHAADAERMMKAREEARKRFEARHAMETAKVAAKKAEEERAAKAEAERLQKERTAIEKIWEENQATTLEDRRTYCTHSSFWPKETFKKKAKCGACGQKRGIVMYTCPHCTLQACQLCLNDFNKKTDRKAGKEAKSGSSPLSI